MAVARLVIPTTVVLPFWSEVETNLLHDQMIAALVQTGVVDVVERTRLDKVLTEQALTRNDITDANDAAKLGKVVGAGYFVIGTLAAVEVDRNARALPYTNKTESTVEARIKIDFRLIDVESSRVVVAASEETVEQATGLSGSEPPGANRQLWDRLAQQAASNVARRVVDALVPLAVVAVNGAEVELNRGASTGVSEGDVFDVVAFDPPLKEASTGRVVDRRERSVGRIEVTRVGAGSATARVVDRTGELAVGAVCRPPPSPAAAPPAARSDPLKGRW